MPNNPTIQSSEFCNNSGIYRMTKWQRFWWDYSKIRYGNDSAFICLLKTIRVNFRDLTF